MAKLMCLGESGFINWMAKTCAGATLDGHIRCAARKMANALAQWAIRHEDCTNNGSCVGQLNNACGSCGSLG